MILKIAVCDDNLQDREHLHSLLNTYEMQNNIDFEIVEFAAATDLIHCEQGHSYDVLFLDVEMPECNGLELADKLRRQGDYFVKIVFVTSYPEYMQDSFNVQAYHYLQKPVIIDTLNTLLNRIIEDYKRSETVKSLIDDNGTEVMIRIEDILYIESNKNIRNHLIFHFATKNIITKGILRDWEDALKPYGFLNSNRGILVNLNHIHFIHSKVLTLDDGTELPLSRRQEKELHNCFSKHIIKIKQM
jgi:DNA-binding LytR/AlgR family response regulator